MTTRLHRLLNALTHSGPGYQPDPLPRRGDPVEQWLKAQRDASTAWSDWRVLDTALDCYRRHADTGAPHSGSTPATDPTAPTPPEPDMHDPLTVAYEIRRPWPRHATWRTEQAARTGTRWKASGAFWVIAGRGLYWPALITVWHRDPSGYDDTTCRTQRWRLHIHHLRLQIHPLQHLRRRLLTRCAWCRGRSRKGDAVNVSRTWDGPRGHWWQGEPGLYHSDCSGIKSAHTTCVCKQPVLEHDDWGSCARCHQFRPHGITPEQLARVRGLSVIPHGARRNHPEAGAR